jgi:magnesium transporter
MVEVFAHLTDGRFVSGPLTTLDWQEDHVAAWFLLRDPSAEELAWLGRQFRFHPLAIEDCAHFDQRAKIEDYGDHLFVVLHGLLTDAPAREEEEGDRHFRVFELHCFLTDRAVVTVHEGEAPPLQALAQRIARDRANLPSQADFILHRILDAVMDANPQPLEAIERRIEDLDDEVLQRGSDRSGSIRRIHDLIRELNDARHLLMPQREIFQQMLRANGGLTGERAQVYLRDVYDHLIRLTQEVDRLRESLWSARDAQLAFAAYRTNEAMRRLTVFSVVFLPLTFITGFFGMNFVQIDWGNHALFRTVVLAVLLLPVGMLAWFARKDWL